MRFVTGRQKSWSLHGGNTDPRLATNDKTGINSGEPPSQYSLQHINMRLVVSTKPQPALRAN